MPNQPKQNSNFWLLWSVPSFLLLDYILKIFFFTIVIPWLFGANITASSFLLNFLIIDFFIYYGYKVRGFV